MTVEEFLIRMLAAIKPMAPAAITVLAVTTALTVMLAIQARGMWVNHPHFRRLGLFFALSKNECLRLACAWIKLLLLIVYILSFRKMDGMDYILFLTPALVYALSVREPLLIPGRLLWIVLETIGLLSANLVCGYYHDMRGEPVFLIVYVVMAIFMLLFGCYLFLTEIDDISEGRSRVKENG